MKTITINVSEPVYRDFKDHARKVGRPTSELIRQAMEDFHERELRRSTSLRQRRPASVGGPVKPLSADDDLLEEMLNDSRD